jgi:hypothetical protein
MLAAACVAIMAANAIRMHCFPAKGNALGAVDKPAERKASRPQLKIVAFVLTLMRIVAEDTEQ